MGPTHGVRFGGQTGRRNEKEKNRKYGLGFPLLDALADGPVAILSHGFIVVELVYWGRYNCRTSTVTWGLINQRLALFLSH